MLWPCNGSNDHLPSLSSVYYTQMYTCHMTPIMSHDHSQACAEVVDYIGSCYDTFTATLDGKNLFDVLTEFGIRLFYLLQSHILEYQYTAIGEWAGLL